MATRYYGTATAYAVAHAAFSQELALSSSAPSSGSSSEDVRKASDEATHMWTGPAAGTGTTVYSDSASQSLDLSSFPAGLSLTTGQQAEDAQTAIVTDGGVSDVDAVQMGAWSSTTGTGIKTRSYASGSFDAGTFATSDEVSWGVSVHNADTKNTLSIIVDFSSNDTWVEISFPINAPAGNAAGTGAANQPSKAIKSDIGNAAGSGSAYDATISHDRNAPAEAATGTGTAYDATVDAVEQQDAYAAATMADGDLLAYWRFDDTGSTAVDETGNYDGTIDTATEKSQPGLINVGTDDAFGFPNSTSAGVSIPSGMDPWDNAFTLECWATTDIVDSNYRGVMSKEVASTNGFRFGQRATSSGWSFWTSQSGGSITLADGFTPVVGRPYHLVVTWDGTDQWALYVDGVLTDSTTSTGYIAPSGGLSIGWFSGGNWNGDIDEVAVYTAEKDAAWVAARYDFGLGNYAALVRFYDPDGYWPMAAPYLPIADRSGNRFDATVSGNPTYRQTGPTINGDVEPAIAFDGTGDYGTVSEAIDDGVAQFTVTGWFKTTDTNAAYMFAMADPGGVNRSWAVYWAGSGDLALYGYDSSNAVIALADTVSQNFDDGAWHFFAGWRDASGYFHIRIDDSIQADDTAPTGTWRGATAATMWMLGRSDGYDLAGSAAHFAYWKSDIGADARTALYTGSSGTNAPAEVAAGTGAANLPAFAITVASEASTGAGAAYDTTVDLANPVYPSEAAGAGASNDATPAITTDAENAVGAGAVNQPTPAVLVQAALSTGTGNSYDVTAIVATEASEAAGTGLSYAVTAIITTDSEVAIGSGASNQPTVSTVTPVYADAENAAGTGVAQDTSIDITSEIEAAVGTGIAQDASTGVTSHAENAPGTGAANSPIPAVGALPVVAAGTGIAELVSAAIRVMAELAAGAGQSYDATISSVPIVNAPAELAAGAGAAQDATLQITTAVEIASAIGAAYDPTVQISGTTHAPAELASGVGTALDLSTNITLMAGVALGVGSTAAIVNIAPCAGGPVGSGNAYDVAADILTAAEVALGTGVANQPSVSVAGTTNVYPSAATGSGVSYDAIAALGGLIESATGTGSAQNIHADIVVFASPATGGGEAFDATAVIIIYAFPPAAEGAGVAYDGSTAVTVLAAFAVGTGEAFDPSITALGAIRLWKWVQASGWNTTQHDGFNTTQSGFGRTKRRN